MPKGFADIRGFYPGRYGALLIDCVVRKIFLFE
jgi:hypothetical protein